MKRSLLAASLVLAAFTLSAQADDRRIYALEDRVEQLENRLRGTGMLTLAEDIRHIQAELRELRGEVERLQYENEQAKVRQREMYLDLERRIQALEQQRQQPAPVSTPSTGGSSPTGQPGPGLGNGSSGDRQPDSGPAPAASGQNEEQSYLAAFELLKQGRYADAIQGFSGFLQNYPQSEYADNAQYWLGEAYYVSRDFSQSLPSFQRLVQVHPQSPKMPGALLKIGYIHYERGEYDQSRAALQRVTSEFPQSSAASLARQRLQRMDTEGR